MTPTTGSDAANRRPPGIRTSAARVVAHARALARLEQELARTELETKGALMGGGAATAVAAGLLLLYAIGFGLATVAAVLALVVNWWLALLIVFVLLLLLAIALAFASRSLFRSGAPLRPVQAIEEAQLTRETLRSSRAG